MHLQKFNLVSTLQKTDLSDVGSYYCSPSFCRPPSRKLAINTMRSLASIFSNSLCSFLETKNFFNNETSLCGLLNMFLFLWCCTNSSNEQPANTTCYFFLLSFWKKFGGAAKKPPNLESHLNASLMNSADWLKGIYAVVDWLYIHIWKQLYTILIGCISFSHMWK